jgi:hypothetical protein
VIVGTSSGLPCLLVLDVAGQLVHEDDVQVLSLVGRFYTSCSGIWSAVCPYVLPLLSTSMLLVNCVGSCCLLFFVPVAKVI